MINTLHFQMKLNKYLLQKIDLTLEEFIFCKIFQKTHAIFNKFLKFLRHGLMALSDQFLCQ